MGEIVREAHIRAGGVKTPSRKNEVIIIQDCHHEEGYGVYVTDAFSGDESFTVSFGYGPMAEIMANQFYKATVNYHKDVLSKYDETLDLLKEDAFTDEEWDDEWLKITHLTDRHDQIINQLHSEESNLSGLKPLLEFIAKWGFEEGKQSC